MNINDLPISDNRKKKFIEMIGKDELTVDIIDNTWDKYDYNIIARELFNAPNGPLYIDYMNEYKQLNTQRETELKKLKYDAPSVKKAVKKDIRDEKISLFKKYFSRFTETYVKPTTD